LPVVLKVLTGGSPFSVLSYTWVYFHGYLNHFCLSVQLVHEWRMVKLIHSRCNRELRNRNIDKATNLFSILSPSFFSRMQSVALLFSILMTISLPFAFVWFSPYVKCFEDRHPSFSLGTCTASGYESFPFDVLECIYRYKY